MSNISKLTGTPWHVEPVHRQEGDPKRHKSRCRHYDKDTGHCDYWCSKCYGSAHCMKYSEKENVSPHTKHIEASVFCTRFEGTKVIPLDLIVVEPYYKTPSLSKINKIMNYYKKNGKFDKAVIVSIKGGKYHLEDGYARYHVAKLLEMKKITAVMEGFSDINRSINLIKIPGKAVWHKKYGEGQVISAKQDKVVIRFNGSNKEVTFGLEACVKSGIIKPL